MANTYGSLEIISFRETLTNLNLYLATGQTIGPMVGKQAGMWSTLPASWFSDHTIQILAHVINFTERAIQIPPHPNLISVCVFFNLI